MSFESRYDRVAAALGFDNAPLVGWWLRFYRAEQPLQGDAPDLASHGRVPDVQYGLARQKAPGFFVAALGTFPIITFLATSRFMVNQFGYLGGGYRRCFLLPVEPAAVLRTGSYASLLLSAGFHSARRCSRGPCSRRSHSTRGSFSCCWRAPPRACSCFTASASGPRSTARAAAITTRASATTSR